MVKISVSKELKEKLPKVRLICIECEVYVMEKNDALWDEIQHKTEEISSTLVIEKISSLPAISASRNAYKVCGKDPARYRLSAEALLRRVVKREELYQVNNVVDLLNLISISTGFSIGGYDAGKIRGDVIFGTGTAGEPYSGIGRGSLNIENLPVFRDDEGAFGSPTSDSVRTSVTPDTKQFVMIIINFGGGDSNDATKMATGLLERYGYATHIKTKTITA